MKSILTVLACLSCTMTMAGSFYVDKNASGSNNGSSWANAWSSFSAINWSSVNPGDTIYISGGSSSKTYYEQLKVGASGSSAARITITKGVDSGHNGEVIIDSQNTRYCGLQLYQKNYINIKNLSVRNAKFINTGYEKGNINLRNAFHVTVENCNIYNPYAHGGIYLDGYGDGGEDVLIKNNTISTPVINNASQLDGIYCQLYKNVTFDGNNILIRQQNSDEHCDCIQTYQTENITMKNNFLKNTSQATLNQHVIMVERNKGYFYIYNNIMISDMPNNTGTGLGIFFGNRLDSSYRGTYTVYNNTFDLRTCKNGFALSDIPNSTIKNNIIYGGEKVWRITDTNMSTLDIDNNYYRCTGDIAYTRPTGQSETYLNWSEWLALGFDDNSIKGTDPGLVDIEAENFELKSTSPCINKGVTYTPANPDFFGNPRDSQYDLGALEFVDTAPPTTPTANAGQDQTVNDNDNSGAESVTLNGSGSSDPDGTLTSYIWSESGAQIATGVNPTVAMDVGTHTIVLTVTDNDGNTDTDTVVINVNPDVSQNQKLQLVQATSSTDDGNVAANTLDGNLSTRWSAEGDGEWIQFELAQITQISQVKAAFFVGDTRSSIFDVQVSDNGSNWTNVVTNFTSSGSSLNLETITFNPVDAKYIRLLGHGNSSNLWNSYTEVEIWGTPEPATEYNLTVNSGTGSGNYAEGANVNISAATAPAGKLFDTWSGDVANIADITKSTTSITMPAGDVNVSASYKDIVAASGFQDGEIYHDYDFYSQARSENVRLKVYVPLGYNDPRNATKKYPAIYFLHGYGGYAIIIQSAMEGLPWVQGLADGGTGPERLNRLMLDGEIPPMFIIGCEDGSQTGGPAGWSESAINETMVTQELVAYSEAKWRIIPERRGRSIEGFSMGSGGTFSYGLRHRDLYASMLGMSWFSDDFSPWSDAQSIIDSNLKIRIVCGDADSFYNTAVNLHDHLTSNNIPHEYEIAAPGIAHDVKAVYSKVGVNGLKFHANAWDLTGYEGSVPSNANDTIRFFPRAGHEKRMMGGIFEGTNGDPDSGPYELIAYVLSEPATNWNELQVDLKEYQHIRYRSPNGGWGNVAEIEYIRDGTKLNGTLFGTPGSYNNLGNDFAKVYDGDTTTFFDATITKDAYAGMTIGQSNNQAPLVDAGVDQVITLPAVANLDGTVTDDGLPAAYSVQWTMLSGPGGVTFGNANAEDTSASFATDGTYVLRLTANDSELQASSNVTIIVNPEPVEPPTGDAFVEANGAVCIEAENYDAEDSRSDPNGASWTIASATSGSVGSYVTTPGPQGSNGSWSNACELTYQVNFGTAGTYKIWVRRYATGGVDNSGFVGMDDAQAGYDNTGDYNQWTWKGGYAITVSAGTHTIQLRRREAGYQVDRIYLTMNGDTPSGIGPDESERGDTNPPVDYNLAVNGGTGSGDYTEGSVVAIVADPAPAGQEFDAWVGDVANIADVNSASTDLTMPANNVVVTATYKDLPTGIIDITVVNPSFELDAAGNPSTVKTTDFTNVQAWIGDAENYDAGVESSDNWTGVGGDGAMHAYGYTGDTIHQVLSHIISEGEKYTLTFSAAPVTSSIPVIAAILYDDNGTLTELVSYETPQLASKRIWAEYSVNVTIPADSPAIGKNLALRFTFGDRFESNPEWQFGWGSLDNIRLQATTNEVPPPVANNLLENPDFETGDTTSWLASGNIVADPVHGGTAALEMLGNQRVAQDIKHLIEAGKTYRFRAYIKVTAEGTSWGSPRLRVSKWSDLGAANFGEDISANQVGDWVLLELNHTFTQAELDDANYGIFVGVINFGFDNGVSVIDDFEMIEE